ncbi:MAG: hypothetical protein K8I29_20010 [Alphaproteobacteria bacterium]|uniref:Uncharacterized protein n=1 Tax=Candidatus Nitrobium versatile TaxID=2884831 RepID=A0A953SIJ0_9BACT|nr:hypothetical protein [Candidatus Nitrobium versatile]
MRKVLMAIATMILLCSPALHAHAADRELQSLISTLDMQAHADPGGFTARLSIRSDIPRPASLL